MPEVTLDNADKEAARIKEWIKIREDLKQEGMALAKKLQAPFPEKEVKWKPQVVKGNRALAIAYIDARAVEDRLDEVVGPNNWHDEYEIIDSHSVLCKLYVRMGGEWVMKPDVGNTSDQPDPGDRLKAGFSDALKRAAVKFGVGRYLYDMPQSWEAYDPVKKKFVNRPTVDAKPDDPEAKSEDHEPAPEPLVSEAQQKAIKELLVKSGVKTEEFLKVAKIDSLDLLPAPKFAGAVSWIVAKIAPPTQAKSA